MPLLGNSRAAKGFEDAAAKYTAEFSQQRLLSCARCEWAVVGQTVVRGQTHDLAPIIGGERRSEARSVGIILPLELASDTPSKVARPESAQVGRRLRRQVSGALPGDQREAGVPELSACRVCHGVGRMQPRRVRVRGKQQAKGHLDEGMQRLRQRRGQLEGRESATGRYGAGIETGF